MINMKKHNNKERLMQSHRQIKYKSAIRHMAGKYNQNWLRKRLGCPAIS